MADFDMTETHYEDFYLSNFFNKKKPKNNNVEVEVVGVDDTDVIQSHYSDIDIEKDGNNGYKGKDNLAVTNEYISFNRSGNADLTLPTVKTEVIRHKNMSCDRCEPFTLQVALKGIEKNKNIQKAVIAAEKQRIAESECDKCTPKKRGKNKPKRSKGRKFAIVLFVIIFAFVSCFLIADVLSNGYLIDSVVTKLFKGDATAYYYAVEIATFNDVDSARITSEEIRASGGSGYVVHDDLYRVIAEVYSSEKDAESVSTNLNLAGYVTNIYLFKIEDIEYRLLPTSVRNATKNVLKYQDIMYKSLFNTAVSLEKQEIDYTSAREDIAMLKSQISNMLIDYESSVNNKINDKYVQKVRMQISSMIGALDNLTAEGSKNDRLLSDIRYINTMILNTHRALIKSLQSESN